MAAVSGATGGAAGGLSLELVDIVGAAGGVALAPGAGVGAAGGTALAPGLGLVPGARAGAARMQAPKCRRQSSAVTYVLGSRVTVAGGGTFVLGAIVVAASGIAPRASSVAAAVGAAPLRLLPRLGRPPGLLGVVAAWWRCCCGAPTDPRPGARGPRDIVLKVACPGLLGAVAPAGAPREDATRTWAPSSRKVSAVGLLRPAPRTGRPPQPSSPKASTKDWASSALTASMPPPAMATRRAAPARECCSLVPYTATESAVPRGGTSIATPVAARTSRSTAPPSLRSRPRASMGIGKTSHRLLPLPRADRAHSVHCVVRTVPQACAGQAAPPKCRRTRAPSLRSATPPRPGQAMSQREHHSLLRHVRHRHRAMVRRASSKPASVVGEVAGKVPPTSGGAPAMARLEVPVLVLEGPVGCATLDSRTSTCMPRARRCAVGRARFAAVS